MYRQKSVEDAKGKKVTRLSYRVNEVSYSTGTRFVPVALSQRLTAPPQTSLPPASLPEKRVVQIIKTTRMRKLVAPTKGSASRIFSSKDWDTFFQLTDNPPEPARALREAYRTYKEQFDSEE